MSNPTQVRNHNPLFMERIQKHQARIFGWLREKECCNELPLYSSMDIRDAGFKLAVVDTNLFPAGFNNLCEHGLEDSVGFIKNAIYRRVPQCQDILIVAEEHTRNTWYLENIRIIEDIIKKSGFNVRIATFLTIQPEFCTSAKYVELETATGQSVRIHCFKRILQEYEAGKQNIDLIILNNDLTSGIPDILKNSKIPIYPSLQAGWHARQKSHHFDHANQLVAEFSKIVDLDPWLFSSFFDVQSNVDINEGASRQELADRASKIFKQIEGKYKEHKIDSKPYLVLKDDAGTYGMGVIAIEDPQEILTLNRRARNNLSKGKSARVISRLLIQEGVPTIHNIDEYVSEIVIYQIENNLIGGFYRFNTEKTDRENLNSSGMGFKKMCPHLKKYGDDDYHPDMTTFDTYRILARIAGIAAHREVVNLEATKQSQVT